MNDTPKPLFVEGELLAGKYRVERVIGEGGMGVVLAARHEALGTSVAIKLLRTTALGHTDVVGRFMREARASVGLRSEHVARVFDVGDLEDGQPFIVMERLEGSDLGAVIQTSGPLPIGVAVDYVMQACEAIAEAHAAGIIHRDLKPQNLFLTRAVDGRPLVKVLDFGISKLDKERAPAELQLTRTTEVIGSPSYMSPEQLRSTRDVDARTDIWALGVILYELLTGRLPFVADTMTALVLVIASEQERSLRSLRPDVPVGLEAIVARCLDKQADRRFANVVDLVQALEPYAQGIVQASISDRVRAVAGRSGPALPAAAASSGTLPASSRVNVHGGTSVAWGETQSAVGPSPIAPPAPKRSRAGLIVGAVVGGVVLVAGSMGTGVITRAPARAAATAPAGPDSAAIPLPPGRKDLPPIASASAAATTPESEVSPSTSALPEVRKPLPPKARPPRPDATAERRTPSAAHGGADDLRNIGRR